MSILKKLLGKFSCENHTARHYPRLPDFSPAKAILDRHVGKQYSLLVVGPVSSIATKDSTGPSCRHLDSRTTSLNEIVKAKNVCSEIPQVLVLSAWLEKKAKIHHIARKLEPHFPNLLIFYADQGRFPDAHKLGGSLLSRNKFISKFIKNYTLTEELFRNTLGIYFFQRTKQPKASL